MTRRLTPARLPSLLLAALVAAAGSGAGLAPALARAQAPKIDRLGGEPAGDAPAKKPAHAGKEGEPDDAPEPVTPQPAPATPDAVERLLAAPYLTDEQRKDKRVFFGRAAAADLDTPARAARNALNRGVYDDPALASPAADPLDRAEAALLRGDLKAADALLAGKTTPRAARLRVGLLEVRGDYAGAAAAAEAAVAGADAKAIAGPEDAVETVRLYEALVRLRGAKGATTAGDYQRMMQTLAEVRTGLDRLYWPAMLAEAELLAARDNKPEAEKALTQALALNPECARAWALLGQLAVDSFNFPIAERVARRLDVLDSALYDPADPDALPDGLPMNASPGGAVIVARSLLRQSEGAQALGVLDAAFKRYPDMPELRAVHCAALAVKFDFDAAAASVAQADADLGPSALWPKEVGSFLAGARQYARSKASLEEALRRQPNDADTLVHMGLMLLQEGDDEGALPHLERAFTLDPFNAAADNSLRLCRELRTYERVESEHYAVRFKPGRAEDGGPGDGLLAREMLAPLEANHAAVAGPTTPDPASGRTAGGFDYTPARKTVIDLMPDHRWFGVRIAGMPAIHTIAASTGPVIAMESPRNGPNHLGTYDWVRVLRHEYTHTITLGRTRNRIPHWFTEAAAVYLEMAPRDWPTVQLLARALDTDALFDFNQINIAFVRPEKPTDRQQAYAQGHWMYEYIVERFGPGAPVKLMDKYAAGVREEEAYGSVLGVSRADFMRDFKAWARTQVVAWGMALPEGEPTVRQLLAREVLDSDAAKDGTLKSADLLRLIADSRDPTPPPAKEGEEPRDLSAVELPEPTQAMIDRWLETHPKHPDVLELAADKAVEAAGGRATPAIAPLLERYAAARPVDPKPHRLLAQMYLSMNPSPASAGEGARGSARAGEGGSSIDPADARQAIPHLEFLDARETKVPTYAMELARRYAAVGDLKTALARAERATQIAPFEPRPRELAATIAVQARDLPAAERHITALTEIEPTQTIHQRRLDAVRKMRADPGH